MAAKKKEKPLEEHKASPEMQLFFKKLLDLKQYVNESRLDSEEHFLEIIYERLDEIIKEAEE